MRSDDWTATHQRHPEPGALVEWIEPSGSIVKGRLAGRLWLIQETGVYVYYTPRFWRPREEEGAKA